jgi:hypothetical protein
MLKNVLMQNLLFVIHDVRCLYIGSRGGGNKWPKFIAEAVGSVKVKYVVVLSKWPN